LLSSCSVLNYSNCFWAFVVTVLIIWLKDKKVVLRSCALTKWERSIKESFQVFKELLDHLKCVEYDWVLYSDLWYCDLPRCILFLSFLIIVFLYWCCQEVLCILEGIKINILGVVWCLPMSGVCSWVVQDHHSWCVCSWVVQDHHSWCVWNPIKSEGVLTRGLWLERGWVGLVVFKVTSLWMCCL